MLEFEWFENEKDAVGVFNEFIVSLERKTNKCKLLEITAPSENIEKHVQDNLETIYNQQKPLLRLIFEVVRPPPQRETLVERRWRDIRLPAE